jgi:hypothetical protein
MENLAKLTDYKPAPTATMQKGGRRNKNTRKHYKRGGAYPENDNYDKILDRLERGETVDKNSHPIDIEETTTIDIPDTTVFADDDEYDEVDDVPGDMKAGGSRRRKHRRHKKSKKRTHKRRRSGKRGRKTRR